MSSKTIENVKTINSVVRTALLLGCFAVFGFLAWLGYANWIKPGLEVAQIKEDMAALEVRYQTQQKELEQTFEELAQTRVELEWTQTALKLVKVDHRKAVIKVLEKGVDAESEEPYFVVEFTEVAPDGLPISEPREFRLRGTLMYVDCWLVKFNDKHIEQADALRSETLCIFKGITGNIDGLEGAQPLDMAGGDVNSAYGTLDPKSEFERQIWEDFWGLANDPVRQHELGIRSNHGQINYLQVEEGKVYEVDLRASDGVSLEAVEDTHNTSTRRPSG